MSLHSTIVLERCISQFSKSTVLEGYISQYIKTIVLEGCISQDTKTTVLEGLISQYIGFCWFLFLFVQDVLKTYKSQHKVLASLESRLEQLRPDESLKKKVKSLRERYEQLEECDINAWLEVFRLFFDEVRCRNRQTDRQTAGQTDRLTDR